LRAWTWRMSTDPFGSPPRKRLGLKIDVKLYGPFSLMSGRTEFHLDFQGESVSLESFFLVLCEKLPRFGAALRGSDPVQLLNQRILCMINESPCVDPSRILVDGDRIQILTPVSGG